MCEQYLTLTLIASDYAGRQKDGYSVAAMGRMANTLNKTLFIHEQDYLRDEQYFIVEGDSDDSAIDSEELLFPVCVDLNWPYIKRLIFKQLKTNGFISVAKDAVPSNVLELVFLKSLQKDIPTQSAGYCNAKFVSRDYLIKSLSVDPDSCIEVLSYAMANMDAHARSTLCLACMTKDVLIKLPVALKISILGEQSSSGQPVIVIKRAIEQHIAQHRCPTTFLGTILNSINPDESRLIIEALRDSQPDLAAVIAVV